MISLRGRFVWFLCFVALSLGLMTAASEIVHAQSTQTFTLSGTVTDKDGAAVAGFSMEASGFPTKFTTRADGSYVLVFFPSTIREISVGDAITITVKDRGEVAAVVTYTVTAADIPAIPPGAIVDIRLSGLDINVSPTTLPADGMSTATITVNIVVGGEAVSGDSVTITPEQGTVGDVTDNGDGTYTATYTAPELVLTDSTMDTITIESTTTGETSTATVIVKAVPTQVSVVASPNSYTANGSAAGMVTVTVSRGANAVSDAEISVSASRADGGMDTGSVGAVTNNGDGTYSASYTQSNMAGRVTITAADAVSGASASAAVSINAGAASSLTVGISPSTVSSGGSAKVSVMVTDASGNGVGGLTASGSAASGMVGAFSEGGDIGSYTATYTATMVDAEGTDVVTVGVGNLTGVATVGLTPEPPVMVTILVVTGTVNKADGTGPVPGVDVEVTVNDKPPLSTTTGGDGSYSVTIVRPNGDAGSTGDTVTVVVTDADGNERGRDESVLTNEDLGDGDSAVVQRDVSTDIVASTSALVVTGSVFREASEIAIADVFDISVMNTTRGSELADVTNDGGMYSVTFFDTSGAVAETGDMVAVTASRGGIEVGTMSHTLSSDEVEAGRVEINVPTMIKASTSALAVTGSVYHDDGMLTVGSGMTVTVMNAGRELQASGTTDADGMYSVTFFSPTDLVGETGDRLAVTVMSGGTEVGSMDHMLTSAEVDAQRATVDVTTIVKASTSSLVVTGTAYFLDSEIPVGSGLTVVVLNTETMVETSAMTDANGMYSVTYFSPSAPVAKTGDVLNVTVMYDGAPAGSAAHMLMASEIDAQRAMVDVNTSVKAETSVFNVTGAVFLEDGMSHAPAGLTVKVTNVNQGVEAEGWTTGDGSYSVTLVSASMAVAKTADELTLDVTVMADTAVVGTTSHTLTTDEVVARRIGGIDITTSVTADPTNLMVVTGAVGNPDGTPAAAGVEIRLTLGSNPTRELQTASGGGYMTTFFDPQMSVASVGDSLAIEVLDRESGAAATESMMLASYHVLARRVTYNITLIADNIAPVPVPISSQTFVEKGEVVDFDGSGSTDNVGIDTYMWDFGDGNTADTMNASNAYANSGKYVATLTVVDLAGNEAMMSINMFVDTVRLGGLALNTRHGRDVIDKIISLAIARTDVGQSMGPAALLEMMRNDPAMQAAVMNAVNSLLPPGILPKQLLDAELPLIFDDFENVDLENFGNAITARPGSGMGILESKDGGFTRIVTGNKLDLYLAAPREDVGSVTFRFDGPGYDPLSEVGTQDAREVEAGMTMAHTFHLEEEQAILLLPSWPGLSEGAGAFSSVTLRYGAQELPPEYANLLSRGRQLPTAYASAPLSPMIINGEIVWSAEVGIEPGKIYYYYYQVELNTPVPLVGSEGETAMLSRYAIPDPRNLQLEDRGVIEALFTMQVQDAVAPFLNPVVEAIVSGQDVSSINVEDLLTGENLGRLLGALTGAAYPIVMDIMTSLDPQMVSVFTVPMSTADQSVWYATIDLSTVADGLHTIDANAFDSEGVQIDNRPVYGKTFELDRSAPQIDIAVENGQNSAIYARDDGVLITTGLLTPDPNQMASLMLSASTMDSTEDLGDFMFQIIRHSDDPAMQMANAWVPLIDPTMAPMLDGLSLNTFDVFVTGASNDLLTVNALAGEPTGMLRPYQMLIRGMNNQPDLIVGEYGLRAVAMDDVRNLSSYTAPVRVDIVPPDPDKAIIANIELGDCNRDGDLEDPFESGPPSADSTIFANTLSVKLTVEIPNRTVHPLTGIVVQYKTAYGVWQEITTLDAPGVVEWNIGNFDALYNGGGDTPHLYVRAVATNALTITDPDPAMPMITLDGDVCPVEPEHIAVDIVPAGTNADTGGACGIITVNGYTAARTIPDLASVRFDLTMPDGTSKTIGEAMESEIVSPLETADLTAILGNMVNTVVEGIPTASQEVGYRKWSVTFNSAPLLDSLDTPYVVNATMIGVDGMEYAPIAGGSDSFLLHNGDVEVGTAIVQVADAYGVLPAGDAGFHQLGGTLYEGLDIPIAILTVDPAAPDWRVAGVNLIVHMRNADGSKGDAVDIGEVTVEETVSVDMADITKTGSNKIFTVTITDLGVLGVGGDYVLQALAYDSKAEPDVEAEDASFGTAANVDNYTPPPMITIDGRGEGMSLADFMAAHPVGYRIAMADDNMFPFTMNAPGVLMGDISVQIDGGMLAADMVAIDGARHDFSIVTSTAATDEGDHPASGTITKRNGSVAFDLVNLAIDRIPPVITVLAPLDDSEVSALPTIHAIYNDGDGYGIAVASDDPLDVAANVEIQITRMTPPDEAGIPVNQDELEDTDDSVVYSRDEQLAGGAYRTDVSVTDRWGNRSSGSMEFTVVGTLPSVTILSPMTDSVSDDGMPLISAAITGIGALDVVAMIDGEAIDAAVEGNQLQYTPEAPLAEGQHTVTIQVTDPDGKMAEASVTFSVEFDHSPPVISQVSPLGTGFGPTVTLSVTAIDDQSGVASVTIALDGGEAVDGASRDVDGLALGQHTATATATNGDGYASEYTWTFTVYLDEESPTIGTTSPHGVVRTTSPTITTAASDESGIASIDIAVMNSGGEVVEGETAMAEDGTSASFNPGAGLANDTYTVAAVVTDNAGNIANTNWSFTLEASYDTTQPSIDVTSPHGIVRGAMPIIRASASDVSDTAQEGLSGIASIEISVAASDGSAIDGASEFDGGSAAAFTPAAGLANGEYTASATVTDNSGNLNTASWSFTVEVIMDMTAPSIGNTSPQGVSRSAMPEISVAATDDLSGIGSIEIAVMNSAGDAVDGSTAMGEGSAIFTPSAALANDTYTATTVVTDNSGNVSTASWSFSVEVIMDVTAPVIANTSPQGISRSATPEISVAATDDLSGIGSIEIAVMNSAGDAVDGSTAMGDGAAIFTPSAALANDTYTVSTVVSDNSGNTSTATWSFVVEVVMDVAEPIIGATSPSGIVRIDMPTITASATDDLSGVGSIEISVAAGDGSAVDGSSEFDGGTMGTFTPSAALANDTYTATAVATDNAGNETRGSWSFTVEVVMDTMPPAIAVTSPQGLVRSDMPAVSVSATDDMSGVGSVSITVSNSNGQIAGSTDFDGEGIGTFTPTGASGNDTYTVNAVVTDNAGNSTAANWSFTLEADDIEPNINALSPQGLVRTDMPRIDVSATDEISGIQNIEIRVLDAGLSRVAGDTTYEGGTSAFFVPANGLANGTYSVAADVTDKAGNTANAKWSFTLEADDTEPHINTLSPQGIVRTDMPRIDVSATDEISGIQNIEIRVLDAGLSRVAGNTTYEGGTSAFFVPANGLANGTYSVAADVTDKAGNTANAKWSFTLEADRAAPVINTTSPQGTIRTDMPRIDVSATDDLSGIEDIQIRVFRSDFVRIGGPTTFEGGTKAYFIPANALRNDIYSVSVDVTDKSGNEANASWSFTVQVDKTPPIISATSPMGIVRDDMPRVSVAATDDESGIRNIQIRVLNSAFERIGGPTQFSGGTTAVFTPNRALRNGTYTVGVTAVDKNGNQADTSWTFVIEADHTPPVINLTSPVGIIRDETPRVSVSATDDLSGIRNIEIKVYNSGLARVAGPTTFQGGTSAYFTPASRMRNDTYTVGVNVTDKSGNTTNADWAFTIEVDEVPPTIGDTGPHGIIRTGMPRVTVSATDDLSGIKSIVIRVVNAAFARVPGATNFQGGTFGSFVPTGNLDNGVYSVGVDVTDKSGNVASSGWSFTVEVDTTPPTIAHTSPSGSVRPDSPIISIAATDDLSGIASIVITLRDRDQNIVPGQTVFEGGTLGTFVPSRTLDYGTHYVGVKVKDKAGNLANATYSFTVESADGLAMLKARNFPNPFAGATRIAFTLTRSSDVSIEIFDVSMRPVWNMSQRTIEASREVVIGWDGTTTGGEKLARGVYFCQIMVHDSLNPQYAVLKMAIK